MLQQAVEGRAVFHNEIPVSELAIGKLLARGASGTVFK